MHETISINSLKAVEKEDILTFQLWWKVAHQIEKQAADLLYVKSTNISTNEDNFSITITPA